MGNRAVITTAENFKNDGVGVYVHWDGDKNSVQDWLDICKERGYRTPETDCYGWAYLCKEIAEYFDNGLSVGIDRLSNLDCENQDNGVWIIKNWEIIGNVFGECANWKFTEADNNLILTF